MSLKFQKLEPSKKNTAAAILSPALLKDIENDQPMVFFSADNLIDNVKKFNKSILKWYAIYTKAAINIPPIIVILKIPESISVFEDIKVLYDITNTTVTIIIPVNNGENHVPKVFPTVPYETIMRLIMLIFKISLRFD